MFAKRSRIILLLALLVACSQPSPPPEPVVVQDETRILDEAARAALLEVQDDGTLVFARAAPGAVRPAGGDPSALVAGNVVVSEPTTAAPNGLLRKVTAVDTSVPGRTIVHTVQAKIGDAVRRGQLSVERELSLADLRTVSYGTQGVAALGGLQPQADGLGVTINVLLSDTDENPDTTDDRIMATGEVRFKPIIKVDLDLDCGTLCIYDNDLDFLAQIGLDETALLKIAGKGLAGAVLKKTVPLATFDFGAQTFFIGPVPVVITPRIVLELRFDGSMGLTVSYQASQTLTAVAGAKYDDGWQNLSSLSNEFAAGPVGVDFPISVVMDAKAKAALRGELMFYGVVGPTLEFAPWLRFDLKYPRDPIWKLYAGIEGNVGVKIDVLGYSKSYASNLWDDSVEIARAGNTAPQVAFLSGTSAEVGVGITLRVQVKDPEDGPSCCAVSFASSNSADGEGGALGSASGIQPEVDVTFATLGARTITATAVDSKGTTGTATLALNVVNSPPTVAISTPFGGQEFFRGQTFTLRGLSYDINEPNFQLACGSMAWSSSEAGDPLPNTGCELPLSFPSNGTRTLTLTGTDSYGAASTATVSVSVVDPPANLPPVVNVSAPQNGLSIGPDSVIQLAGSATDPEGGAVALIWEATSGYDPQTGTGTATYAVVPAEGGAWTPSDTIPYNSGGCGVSDTLRLRLLATDPQGNAGFDFVVIQVVRIC